MKNRRKQVALLVSPGWYGSALLIRGVQDYARAHGDWTIVPIHENFSGTLGDLMDWNGDGVIANVKTRREAEQIGPLGMPVVGVSGLLPEGLLPRVLTDNEELGRMTTVTGTCSPGTCSPLEQSRPPLGSTDLKQGSEKRGART